MRKCKRCGKKAGFLIPYCNECGEAINRELNEEREKQTRIKVEKNLLKEKEAKEKIRQLKEEKEIREKEKRNREEAIVLGESAVSKIIQEYHDNNITKREAYNEVIAIIFSNEYYCEYLKNSIETHELLKGEFVIFSGFDFKIEEYKNTCEMVRTGLSYERHPIWKVREKLISNWSRITITNSRIFISTEEGIMRFPFNKIVNAGFYGSGRAFFELKTSSPYPHRYIIYQNCENGNCTLTLAGILELLFDMKNESVENNLSNDTNSGMETRHRWTYKENALCCRVCLDEYVIYKSHEDINETTNKLSKELPDIKISSIKMKIQNIKFLFEEYGIENTLNTQYLSSCSAMNREAFINEAKKMGVL